MEFEMLLKALDQWRRNGERFEYEQYHIRWDEYEFPESAKGLRATEKMPIKWDAVKKPYRSKVNEIRKAYVQFADELYKEFNVPGSKGDIVIYTNPERLELKKGNNNYDSFFWTFTDGHEPRTHPNIHRLFFAIKGNVVGYFNTGYTRGELPHYNSIAFDPDSWVDIDPVPTKVFRGFRYRWFDFEQKGELNF